MADGDILANDEGKTFNPAFEARLRANAARLQDAISVFLKTEGSLSEISEVSRDLVENLMMIHEQMEMIVNPPEPPRPYVPPVVGRRFIPYNTPSSRISSR